MGKAKRVTLFHETFAERGQTGPCDHPEPCKVDGLLWPCSQRLTVVQYGVFSPAWKVGRFLRTVNSTPIFGGVFPARTWLCADVRFKREGLNGDMFEVRFALRHRAETWKRPPPATPYPEHDFFEMLDWVERDVNTYSNSG